MSYEGSFTATNGPASGMTSIDIGVTEPGSDAIGNSLQRTGDGSSSWTGPLAETPRRLNIAAGQSLSNASGVAVTLTVTDVNGNASSCTTTVTVEDNVAPNALCTNYTLQLDANGNATLDPANIDGGSTDACGIASIAASQTAFDCSHVGANSVTLTVTDINGNSATCVATVTVEDNEAPTAVCNNNIVIQLDANGNGSLTAAQVDGGSTDACGVASISIDKDTFKLIKVPAQPADKNASKVVSTITLEGETMKVSETRELTGYEKVDFIVDYTFKKDTRTDEEFLNNTFVLGNNKTNYTNFKMANFDNKNTPLVLNYDLSIDSYIKTIGDKMYINLDLDRVLSKSKINIEEKKLSKKIEHAYQKTYETTFVIPEGFKANFIPEASTFEHPNYSFNITYSQKNHTIIQHKTITVNTLSVQKDEFNSWNDFISNIIKAYKKSIIIERI